MCVCVCVSVCVCTIAYVWVGVGYNLNTNNVSTVDYVHKHAYSCIYEWIDKVTHKPSPPPAIQEQFKYTFNSYTVPM